MTSPFWKIRTVPFDSLTVTATALLARLIAAAAQCRAEPLGERNRGCRRIDVTASRFDGSIRRDDDRPVHLGDFLDALANPCLEEVPLLAVIAPHRVEAGRLAVIEHLAGVADDEHRADGLAFAPLAANLDGQVDHHLERLQGNPRLQLAEIAAGKPVEVLAEVDHADRIDRIRLETAVYRHHPGAGRKNVVGHRFQQRLGEPVIDRAVGHVDGHRRKARLGGTGKFHRPVGDHDDLSPISLLPQPRPIGGPVEQNQHTVRFDRLRQPNRHVEQNLEAIGESELLHAHTPPGATMNRRET